MRRHSPGHGGQRGAVLGIGLLFLLVLTLLGTALMQSTTMQERMAGGVQDRNRALQAAETALNVAEAWIASSVAPFAPLQRAAFTSAGQKDDYKALYDTPVKIDDALASGTAVAIDGDPDGDGPTEGITPLPRLASQPVYVIQWVSSVCTGSENVAIFRVTARGWGQSANSAVTLVSEVIHRSSCGNGGGGGGVTSGSNDDSVI